MASNFQIGMHGVFLVAAELTRQGFIVSPTSRNAFGADLLVTDQLCKKAWSVQVKTNRAPKKYWLLNKRALELTSPSHVYVFVSVPKEQDKTPIYLVASSRVVAKNAETYDDKNNTWYSFWVEKKAECEGWELFG